MKEIEMVRLTNGYEVPKPSLESVFMSLQQLQEINPIAFYDAVMLARDPQYRLNFSLTALRNSPLVDSYNEMHDDVRRILTAIVEGDGMNLRLVNPFSDS
jgi:hypothetical protein